MRVTSLHRPVVGGVGIGAGILIKGGADVGTIDGELRDATRVEFLVEPERREGWLHKLKMSAGSGGMGSHMRSTLVRKLRRVVCFRFPVFDLSKSQRTIACRQKIPIATLACT